MEVAQDPENGIDIALGKASIGTSAITTSWIKTYPNTLYSMMNASLCIDEFNEIYMVANCRLKSDDTTRDRFG